jgi:hypothetical protein
MTWGAVVTAGAPGPGVGAAAAVLATGSARLTGVNEPTSCKVFSS